MSQEETIRSVETKCRRCGGLHEFKYTEMEREIWSEHIRSLFGGYSYTMQNCDPCGKITIQDYVSYAPTPLPH